MWHWQFSDSPCSLIWLPRLSRKRLMSATLRRSSLCRNWLSKCEQSGRLDDGFLITAQRLAHRRHNAFENLRIDAGKHLAQQNRHCAWRRWPGQNAPRPPQFR